jgi:beta-mannosidase
MEAVFNEWRRARSGTAGGLVWTYQDLLPGAGWGVVDALGKPKAAWYGLRRAFRPLQIALSDEGNNGLAIHVLNDGPAVRKLKLELLCKQLGTTIVDGKLDVTLEAHSGIELNAWQILGRFFDITYAYRFGPPAHDLTVATLRDADSDVVLAEAIHFPHGYALTPQPLNWQARIERTDQDWHLCLHSEQLAISIHIDDAHYRPEDNWFHLPPHSERRIRLIPGAAVTAPPDGEVHALNSAQRLRYKGEL